MFEDFDFNLLNTKNFKEDSVREEIISPVLKALQFPSEEKKRSVDRSKLLRATVGSKETAIYPDYLLREENRYVLVLEAKSPGQNIRAGKHVAQVLSYSINSEVNCSCYALCNGHEWTFFKRHEPYKPLLIFQTKEIESQLKEIIAFIFSVESSKETPKTQKQDDNYYLNLKLPRVIEKPKKQGTRRHFGVHGYFTKQSWDIVNRHIDNFTQVGDWVLDSYAGSGVTLIEALMRRRKAIHVDLNPLSIFWMEALLSHVDLFSLKEEGDKIAKQFRKQAKQITLKDIKDFLPKNLPVLSKGADAKHLHDFFSKKQLLQLGLLKKLILQAKPKAIQKPLLLAFSSTITKINLTYHNSKSRDENAGNSGIFIYYSYKIAPSPVYADACKSFANKLKNLIKAKDELKPIRVEDIEQSKIIKGDATNLGSIQNESIDYIYTDPPYGKKIEYLDLSLMWNAWLDLEVNEEDYQREAIEGGHLKKNREEYGKMIVASIKEMFRVLKWNRWMSFVFQHQDPYYWHLIVENAEKIGFEYRGVIKQNNGQTSFKKRKNPFRVLSGQLIIHFLKKKNPKTRMKADLGENIEALILNNVEAIIAKKNGATINEINDDLTVNALDLGFLDILSQYGDLVPYLKDNFNYDDKKGCYLLRENTKFKTKVPDELRVKYFLISYLRRENREDRYPDFNDIVTHIIPLLKNGTTPEEQTISSVLDEIAYCNDEIKGYHLREDESSQTKFFPS